MILAVGNGGEYEAMACRAVQESCERRGVKTVFFRQDFCTTQDALEFGIHRGIPHIKIKVDGEVFSPEDFSAVYYMHPHLPKELREFPNPEYRNFINQQFIALRQMIWSQMRDKKWLNDPWAVEMAENKVTQLIEASRVGFSLPETLISHEPTAIQDFYAQCDGEMIVKILASCPSINKLIATNRVSKEAMKYVASAQLAPSIYQKNIPKAYELRITVVGSAIFAAKIYSQSDPETCIDWRRKPKVDDTELKMESATLPEDICKKIRLLMHSLHLRYGCIDMIVTPEGNYVFLEINPNGQWYFVQLRTEMLIAEAIANILTQKTPG